MLPEAGTAGKLDEGGAEAPGSGVEGHPHAGDPAAHDDDVVPARAEALEPALGCAVAVAAPNETSASSA